MLTFAFVAVVTFAVMLAIYFVAHALMPSWGTVITNAVTGIAVVLDIANALPWGTILDAKEAAAVAFAITAGNAVIRNLGPKKPVGSGA